MVFNSKQLGYKSNKKGYEWQAKFKTTDERRIEELENQLKVEQQAHNDLREKLKGIEIVAPSSDDDFCPVCHCHGERFIDGNKIPPNHEKDCWIAKELKGSVRDE